MKGLLYLETPVFINPRVHKNIEGRPDIAFVKAESSQHPLKILLAARMRACDPVLEAIHFRAAGWMEQVMRPHGIGGYLEHGLIEVRIQILAHLDVERAVVVDSCAGRKIFAGLCGVESKKIGYLFTLRDQSPAFSCLSAI